MCAHAQRGKEIVIARNIDFLTWQRGLSAWNNRKQEITSCRGRRAKGRASIGRRVFGITHRAGRRSPNQNKSNQCSSNNIS